VEQGITVKVKNEDEVTSDSRDESNQRFDYDLKSNFNNDVNGDKDEEDEDME
jgi:hypothetical protein